MTQVTKTLILALGLCILFMASGVQAQISWIQVESQRSINDTKARAQVYAAEFPQTKAFSTQTGWYAIVLGPMDAAEAQTTLTRLKADGQIPRDSLITDGGTHISQLWPLSDGSSTPAVTTAETTPEPDAPALIPDPDLNQSQKIERNWSRDEKILLQSYLIWTGDYEGALDGAYGPGTRRSIRLFQECNGFEATGVFTEDQAALLAQKFTQAMARLGAEKVRDLDAGIEVLMPLALVEFDRFDPPFVHYRAKDRSRLEVLLISQEGDSASLAGLYDVMETFDFVPSEGYRTQKAGWFVLSGRDENIISYTYVRLQDGALKGFSLIWTPEIDRDIQPFVAQMYESFTPIQSYVLGDAVIPDTGQDGPTNLAEGLETQMPDHAQTGFIVNDAGFVVAHSSVVDGCSQLSMLNSQTELELLARSTDLSLAILKPKTAYEPAGIVHFSSEAPERGANVSIAGFSFPEVMTVASLNYGTLSDVSDAAGTANEVAMTAYLEDGDIGGPVLDDRGAVIAMHVRRADKIGNQPVSMNYAVKSNFITGFLDRHNVAYKKAVGTDALAPEDMASWAGDFTVKVSCWK